MINVCFSGHRPDKLFGYNLDKKEYEYLELRLYSTIIKKTIKSEYNPPYNFIFGGALGVDQIAFNCCNEFKKRFSSIDITTEIAVPFKNQPNKWFNEKDKERYFKQLKEADKVTYVDTLANYKRTKTPEGEYNAYKLQIRNEYMVDNSDLLIAVWDGSNGGTCNCIKYAKKANKKIIILNPKEIIKV